MTGRMPIPLKDHSLGEASYEIRSGTSALFAMLRFNSSSGTFTLVNDDPGQRMNKSR